jgi:hypothetical protein
MFRDLSRQFGRIGAVDPAGRKAECSGIDPDKLALGT